MSVAKIHIPTIPPKKNPLVETKGANKKNMSHSTIYEDYEDRGLFHTTKQNSP